MTTAEDMKKALESHSGLRGCRVAVVEIDASKDLHGSNKIPDTSLLYNYKYEDNGIRVWKAYNIGGGELLTNKDLPVQQQDIVRLTVNQPFGHRTKERGVIGETAISRSQTGICPCNDRTCVLTFKTERESEAHMDSGKHVKELETLYDIVTTLNDTVRLKWAERVTYTGISDVVLEASVNVILPDESSQNSTRTCSMGWALKATKKRLGLGEKVKAYLVEKFIAGERSGTKADPLSVSREMKFLKGDNGKLIFTPEEWKAQQSIKSFFSRYSAKLRR